MIKKVLFPAFIYLVFFLWGRIAGGKAPQREIHSLKRQLQVCIEIPPTHCRFPHDSKEHQEMLSRSFAKWKLAEALRTDSILKLQGVVSE